MTGPLDRFEPKTDADAVALLELVETSKLNILIDLPFVGQVGLHAIDKTVDEVQDYR